jgi:hypothetical protein
MQDYLTHSIALPAQIMAFGRSFPEVVEAFALLATGRDQPHREPAACNPAF